MRTVITLIALLTAAGFAGAGEMLKAGDAFPAWSLVDQAGVVLSSKDLAGKTYLLWYYPKALSPGCTSEGCALRDNFRDFEKLGVTIVGVSFDDPKSNAKFVAKNNFPFRLLSDQKRELAVAVGAADSPSRMWARRISYLIGPDGKVVKAYSDVSPARHAKEVLADLAALPRQS